jgi:hypothetical protein
MPKHNWVELQVTPIQADLIDLDIITSSTEEAEALAAQESIEICWGCHTALSPLTINDDCPAAETGQKKFDGVASHP